jgi:biopolymer transport protein ExbD
MQIIEQKLKGSSSLARQIKIDMTPMVDLGFLLISFFIFTTSLAEYKALRLYMPADGPPGNLEETNAFTIILDGGNKIAAYAGNWNDAKRSGKIIYTNYDTKNGIGKFIRQKQAELRLHNDNATQLMVLIKPTAFATYDNIVDALDEMAINKVKRYAIVDPDKNEASLPWH